jgi:hypothetical protein
MVHVWPANADNNAILACLRNARSVVSDPSFWCKGWYAKDANGNPVASRDANARQWSLAGAIALVTRDVEISDGALWALQGAVPDCPMVVEEWADDASVEHAALMAAFDKAIMFVTVMCRETAARPATGKGGRFVDDF